MPLLPVVLFLSYALRMSPCLSHHLQERFRLLVPLLALAPPTITAALAPPPAPLSADAKRLPGPIAPGTAAPAVIFPGCRLLHCLAVRRLSQAGQSPWAPPRPHMQGRLAGEDRRTVPRWTGHQESLCTPFLQSRHFVCPQHSARLHLWQAEGLRGDPLPGRPQASLEAPLAALRCFPAAQLPPPPPVGPPAGARWPAPLRAETARPAGERARRGERRAAWKGERGGQRSTSEPPECREADGGRQQNTRERLLQVVAGFWCTRWDGQCPARQQAPRKCPLPRGDRQCFLTAEEFSLHLLYPHI